MNGLYKERYQIKLETCHYNLHYIILYFPEKKALHFFIILILYLHKNDFKKIVKENLSYYQNKINLN